MTTYTCFVEYGHPEPIRRTFSGHGAESVTIQSAGPIGFLVQFDVDLLQPDVQYFLDTVVPGSGFLQPMNMAEYRDYCLVHQPQLRVTSNQTLQFEADRTKREASLVEALRTKYGQDLDEIYKNPTRTGVNTLVLAYQDLERILATYKRVPDKDKLREELEDLQVSNQHLFLQLQLGLRRVNSIDRKLAEGSGYAENPRYWGWTSGELNLFLQYVIHQYLPDTNDDGEPNGDTHLFEFGWTLINMLDGELDHGVYRREQLLEETAKEHGWNEQVDLHWWIHNRANKDDLLTAVETKLAEDLAFNTDELRQQFGV